MIFAYPKSRHVRRLRPRQLKGYKRYKPYLRVEFSATCVYCRLPDTVNLKKSFGVDHYRPASLFPDLECQYVNLFYCCPACNSRKSDYWPTERQLANGIFIPNPCDHSMWEHLRFIGGGAEVQARTKAGEEALKVMGINDEETVKYRRLHQQIVDNAKQVLGTTQRLLADIDNKIRRHGNVFGLMEKQVLMQEKMKSAEAHLAMLFPTSITSSPAILKALKAAKEVS